MSYMKMKISLFLIITFIIISLVSSYLIMLEFSSEISASCFECSYSQEILIENIQSLLLIPLIYLINKFFNKLDRFILSILLALNIFFIVKGIFKSRVSSWSTFNTKEEFIAVMYQSYLGIILSIIFFLIIKYFIDKIRPET